MISAECQQTRELLDSYLSAELLVETNHQILRHISCCTSCRAELARRHRVRTLMKLAMPSEDPPPDLVRRISEIPRGPGTGVAAPRRTRVRSFWQRMGGRRTLDTNRRLSLVPAWRGQALAALAVGALIVLLFGGVPWTPWAPARLTASELLARSDQATRAMANQSDVVLHRSLRLEERRGRGGPVVSRRRIEVWQDAAKGMVFRRAFNEHDALVAGEALGDNGTRTVYRAGASPEKGSLGARDAETALHKLDTNAAWRLDLSAAEFASLLPPDAVPDVEDLPGHFVLKYERVPASQATMLLGATLKIQRDTLLPVEQTVLIDTAGEVREYAFSETRLNAVPRNWVAQTIFQPDDVLLGRVEPLPARGIPPSEEAAARPAAPAPRPSLDAELDVIYRLHRAEVWLRDGVMVSRTERGTLSVSVAVATEARRRQLLAELESLASPGVSVDIRVESLDEAHASMPPGPPADLQAMPLYAQLRDGFRGFIEDRVPLGQRPSADEQSRIVDDLVRSIAARSLERSHGALRRAVALERTLSRFSTQNGQLSTDAEATLQTMLRDYARGIESRLEGLRLELQPVLRTGWSSEPVASETPLPSNLSGKAAELARLVAQIDAAVVRSLGPRADGQSAPTLSDQAVWRAIAEGERLAAAFKDPLPLGAR